MSKSTPGPWEASSPGMDYIVTASDGRKFIVGDAVYHPENEANARLIAAAPDLLKAALLAVSVLGHMAEILGDVEQEPGTVIPQLRAAIAKAEGR